MTLFPFFEDVENKSFVVIGSGKVAKGKVEKLLSFTKNITVIDENADIEGVSLIKRPFEENDIFLGDYVICATDNSEINEFVSNLCRENHIPVNVVDSPENCTFIFPSLIKKGDLTIAIASGGKSPAFCKEMRKRIETIIPENTQEILDKMFALREELKETVLSQKERSRILKAELAKLLSQEEE
ncbi:MAG: bifunctional precorrin-2 dehydrogenase/sirohydrochlorin ferrochelatase [Acutalibacteraceae bacterium]